MSVELALFSRRRRRSARLRPSQRDLEEREMQLVIASLAAERSTPKKVTSSCATSASPRPLEASQTQAGREGQAAVHVAGAGVGEGDRSPVRHLRARGSSLRDADAQKLFTGDNEMSILEQVREARVTRRRSSTMSHARIDATFSGPAEGPTARYQPQARWRGHRLAAVHLRPTPTSADLAIYMHRLAARNRDDAASRRRSAAASARAGREDIAAAAPPVPLKTSERPMPHGTRCLRTHSHRAEEKKKKSLAIPIGIAAVAPRGDRRIFLHAQQGSATPVRRHQLR